MIGLYRAIDLFDWQKGNRFSTYAIQWIRAGVGSTIDDEGIAGTSPIIGAPSEQCYGRKGTKRHSVVSLDRVQTVSNDDTEQTLLDLLPNKVNIEEEFLANEAQEYVKRSVERVLEKALTAPPTRNKRDLHTRLTNIFKNRLLSDDPETLSDIAVREGVSRERIRQIEGTAVRQIADDLIKSGW